MLPDGPSLLAVPFQRASLAPIELLSKTQQAQLSRHAAVRTLAARTVIYTAGAESRSVFIIGDGVVKSFRDLPSGRRRIAAFLFARDVFGLAEAGHYVNTVQAIEPVVLYEIELATLTTLFKQNSQLELQFLCKVVHVLREAQHHNIIIGRRDAAGRLAMFVALLLRQSGKARGQVEVTIPMTRSDIANYLGLSLEAVIRAGRRLERQGIVDFVGRHHARILDRRRFEALATNV
jgi:CRP/FNR family transcriptional regulator